MGDGFTTRVDSLRDAADTAGAVGDRLREAAGTLLSGTGDAGHAALTARMRAFETRLGDLAAGFADEARSVDERLSATAAAYEDVDDSAAAVFRTGFTAWPS